ncbi:MAG: PQQ-binding-like beta-propeller repeat protein [Boseongicola sp. SB0662_bin_57]|nr:PQQ-binding-like beta-propeller repeat protein [Boseongicola sp. SB0662_bin_57]
MVKKLGIPTLVAMALAACGEREELLHGERLDIAGTPRNVIENRAAPLDLPPVQENAGWTHVGGNVRHHLAHLALSRDLSLAWSVSIGQGNDRRHRITADPVVAGGRIYTLDSRARVSAHTTAGEPLWAQDLTPAFENADEGSGGGLAVAGGAVLASSGFGTLTAMEAATGNVRWVQELESAVSGAPAVHEGVVYLVTRNAVGWAIDAENGRILWQVIGATSESGISGGSTPVIAGSQVVFPLPSGQLVAAAIGSGAQTWVASVTSQRLRRAFSQFSELTAVPVVAGGVVYAGNHSGRASAFDAGTGESLWDVDAGGLNPVWIAGGSVFLVSEDNRLMRLDAATGEAVWAQELPYFTRARIARRKAIFAHYGPVLAGGHLLLASNDGMLRRFDPVSGGLVGQMALPAGAARNPVVAGGTLYVVTEDGQLHAFR